MLHPIRQPLAFMASCFVAAGGLAPASYAQPQPTAVTLPEVEPADALSVPEIFPLPPGTVFRRESFNASGKPVTTGSADEKLIYSCTKGVHALSTGTNLLADDIATSVVPGCTLKRIEFPIVGRVNPAQPGGPFSVVFALYSNCPNSVGAAIRSTILIPGTVTKLDFEDDAPRLVSWELSSGGVAIPNSVWFGVSFTRSNAGVVGGAPADGGFSTDLFDFPGFACNASLGGWPARPYGNFNVQLFGDAACEAAHVGYRALKPSGATINPGLGVALVDDIELGVSSCQMIAYETVLKGVGSYNLDFRTQ